uniref:Spermidine hydroxycinnamoyl transferase n=1 Tax=Kalanchoe fedtschenkoi TaxID=63787 RepID=A0A7N0V5X4_KALFE
MITIKNTYTVKPDASTPSPGRFHLSSIDQTGAITHVSTIYVYRRPTSAKPFETLVQNLVTALSKTLVEFYPVAGRLHYIPNGGGQVELTCTAEGAEVTEAESEVPIEHFGDFSPTPLIKPLLPFIDYANKELHEIPLCLAQLTRFPCGAITVGLAVSHVVFDGVAAMLFVSEWSKHARGCLVDLVQPFLDRTILKTTGVVNQESSRSDVHTAYTRPPLLEGQSDDVEQRGKETTVARLELSPEQIAELKNRANLDSKDGRPYSRYEVIAAHMWRCSTKARGHRARQLTRLRIVIDIRNRIKPPLPKNFFGNAVICLAVETTSGELQSNPLGQISSRIRETLAKADDRLVRDTLSYLERQEDVTKYRNFHSIGGSTEVGFFGNPTFDITSWLSLPLYGTDLGWGPEDYMGIGAIGIDGKCFIVASHDTEGSVVVFMRLQVEYMKEFKRCFYEDLK